MKIFLTGSTGFLGKSIVEYLPMYDYFRYQRGDDVHKALDTFNPDVIIHSAAEIYDETKMVNSNIKLTDEITSWIIWNNVKLIYMGSSSEYGRVTKPMEEVDECIPTSMYALSKLIGTIECQRISHYFNKDISIIRPFSVYGPNEPARRLIPTIYENLKVGGNSTIMEGCHDFVYIEDFVKAVDILIHAPKQLGEIYNIGYGMSYTNREIFEKMATYMNVQRPLVEFIQRKKTCDSDVWVCNNLKFCNRFDFKYTNSIDIGLKKYIYWREKLCQHN